MDFFSIKEAPFSEAMREMWVPFQIR